MNNTASTPNEVWAERVTSVAMMASNDVSWLRWSMGIGFAITISLGVLGYSSLTAQVDTKFAELQIEIQNIYELLQEHNDSYKHKEK